MGQGFSDPKWKSGIGKKSLEGRTCLYGTTCLFFMRTSRDGKEIWRTWPEEELGRLHFPKRKMPGKLLQKEVLTWAFTNSSRSFSL